MRQDQETAASKLLSSKNHYTFNLAWLKALPERPKP
jgi:hypothetical protein